MAEEHEKRPSVKTNKKFRQVVKLGSASSWKKFNLDLFQVDYDRHVYDPLPSEVHECAAKEKDSVLDTRTA
jgi:hypothetical protein